MAGTWGYCPKCKEYGSFGTGFMDHRCKPRWECRMETKWMTDDDWQPIHATDSEAAAEKFAEKYDCEGGEYSIVSNRRSDDTIIQVRTDDESKIERFSIEAEAVPTYYGHRLDEIEPAIPATPE
jgi:hypothetical protein